jgi:hypothetical protein
MIMKTLKIAFLVILILGTFISKAQETKVAYSELDKATLGFGLGLDYGGFGGNFVYYPVPKVGLFVGVGYPLAGLGYNFGAKFRFVSKNPTKVNAYLIGMYGYNAAIYIADNEEYNKLFYGPTFGFGIDTRYYPKKAGYWSFALLIPIRSAEVDKYMDDLKNNHNIEFKNSLIPVGFSVGYRIVLD